LPASTAEVRICGVLPLFSIYSFQACCLKTGIAVFLRFTELDNWSTVHENVDSVEYPPASQNNTSSA
jgi:hypothetical protein